LQSLTESKQGVTLFAAVSGALACCIPSDGDANFYSRPLQKLFAENSGMLKMLYILPLTAASAVVLFK